MDVYLFLNYRTQITTKWMGSDENQFYKQNHIRVLYMNIMLNIIIKYPN